MAKTTKPRPVDSICWARLAGQARGLLQAVVLILIRFNF